MSTFTIIFNGESEEADSSTTLTKLLESKNIELKGIAAAINQEVQPKTTWDQTFLNAGDDVVVFKAIAGG
ncbi:putative Thiamine biosynthesis protein ThiS [Vibrio nigripulchritudo SO65]|uniref:Thiamine biosynthesis protein ThiS n=1 Tax=Vibrio nigripulchritudo SOn1 TaxID=1238450 RepID=A0AAV2VPW7_9VIBR|nr:sulfur carrier protein ThiS [Vibrio nigripulchritudo]CCN38110.1 putative Thiamine biosynthesis protein ThiS [Vibrio nigripulchritudo AM115]CCN43959.1 putative Thiamine biosynthesis protein ThiS [Vibrio nigripulchritudo FTn2]CCN66742.1 putative Thiamine biosynthesis protein ThiS [Vibrio nigripulchritudo POn4]CCN74973.1 putative Thiamine biosynthesis protein ThiS [Vibrio nigripulchritudo SO65]CCO46734.1 putative Thiamine biosynthesis protein ThiS [Vibrio nigripulchritudo SOn1]